VSGANVENRGRPFFLAVIRSRKMKYSCGVLKECEARRLAPAIRNLCLLAQNSILAILAL